MVRASAIMAAKGRTNFKVRMIIKFKISAKVTTIVLKKESGVRNEALGQI